MGEILRERQFQSLSNKLDQALSEIGSQLAAHPGNAINGMFILGKLDGPLSRGSFAAPRSAILSVWRRDFDTGVWSDTQVNHKTFDIGIIPKSLDKLETGSIVGAILTQNGYTAVCFHPPDVDDEGETVFVGKLITPLQRGTLAVPKSATYKVWERDRNNPSAVSAWTDTGKTRTVIDTGLIPNARSPIPEGVQIRTNTKLKVDLLAAFDCDFEGELL